MYDTKPKPPAADADQPLFLWHVTGLAASRSSPTYLSATADCRDLFADTISKITICNIDATFFRQRGVTDFDVVELLGDTAYADAASWADVSAYVVAHAKRASEHMLELDSRVIILGEISVQRRWISQPLLSLPNVLLAVTVAIYLLPLFRSSDRRLNKSWWA